MDPKRKLVMHMTGEKLAKSVLNLQSEVSFSETHKAYRPRENLDKNISYITFLQGDMLTTKISCVSDFLYKCM